jgi:hypothetical protein
MGLLREWDLWFMGKHVEGQSGRLSAATL